MVSRHLIQHLDDFYLGTRSLYNDGKRQCTLLCACHTTASIKVFQCVLGDQAMAAQVRALSAESLTFKKRSAYK